ncbi:uncharacterized protein LOC110654593 isoform X2 [Hevea brasiliensis]|uniref:uncharacterized protein LOC110654593 isoform X2 n=1 Tax=Hevea brasiliensis TaxID=3981 RepID=UPI0025D0BCA5|nr:uncharacterized protein LOC110654593 isoform X2 [Hevea brasiliensis]
MAFFASISASTLSVPTPIRRPIMISRRLLCPLATLSSSSSPESASASASTRTIDSSKNPSTPFVESSRPHDSSFNYARANPTGSSPFVRFVLSTESNIERGCVYIFDAYKVYWTSCVKGIHSGQMVLRLVEAIDVYLAGTVMLIFGMGLYGLFISNVPPDVPSHVDRALKGSSLFGMFALKERPKWMKISSLDELKTKVGHVIVMILLVKMFERSKMVTIATGMDLLSYSVCIFLSSASLYILHNLHKSD